MRDAPLRVGVLNAAQTVGGVAVKLSAPSFVPEGCDAGGDQRDASHDEGDGGHAAPAGKERGAVATSNSRVTSEWPASFAAAITGAHHSAGMLFLCAQRATNISESSWPCARSWRRSSA